MTPSRVLASALTVALAAGMGAIAAAPAAMATQCPVVGTPTDYSAAGQYAANANTAMSADSSTIAAIWTRPDDSSGIAIAQFSVSTDSGATFSCVQELSDITSDAHRTDVVTSADGSVITAAWTWDDPGYGYRVAQVMTSTDHGDTWGTMQTLSPLVDRNANIVHLTMSSDGTHISAVWNHGTPMGGYIETSTSTDSGASWSPAVTLSGAAVNYNNPQIVASSDGTHITVVYNDYDTNGATIARSSSDSGATWSAEQYLSPNGANDRTNEVQLAGSSDGLTLTAMWSYSDGVTSNVIQTKRSTDGGGTWATAHAVTPATTNSGSPRIVSSADGATITAGWIDSNSVYYVATTIDGTATWSQAAQLSDPADSADYPALGATPDGSSIVAAWYSSGTSELLQQATSIDSGQSWGQRETLATAFYDFYDVHIAASSTGNRFSVLWTNDLEFDSIVQGITEVVGQVAPAPTVVGASPNTGPTAGGTNVTILGTNFVNGATVKFGTHAATNVTFINSTTLHATSPAGTAGAVSVTVTNPDAQSGSRAAAFTYTGTVAASIVLHPGKREHKGISDLISARVGTRGIPAGSRLTIKIKYNGESSFHNGTVKLRVGADGTATLKRKLSPKRTCTMMLVFQGTQSNKATWKPIK